jgi:uncharacterized membrane protein
MKRIYSHFKRHVINGLLTLIPLGLTLFILKIVYDLIDRRALDLFERVIGFRIPGLGISILLVLLYIVGLITGNIFSRRLIGFFESGVSRIPIIKTTYEIGKQLASTLSMPEQNIFKRVVLVNYFRPKVWTIGFVTGTLRAEGDETELYKVFIPTVPNPTSGVIVILDETQTFDPGWSVDQAMRMVVSGGLIGPEELASGLRKECRE